MPSSLPGMFPFQRIFEVTTIQKEISVYFHYLILFFIIALFSIPTAAAKDLMDPIIVTATKIKTKDTKATYASEIYNRKDIERSGAVSLYDFLNHNTSTAVMPSYGN
ncbi:MAG: hypothetical protein MK238_05195, partial [Nitrospinales bacterium]|nr:hypothetical protein [Nitrospinales bacterium]